MTRVVNVRVAFLRPKYDNLKEWCDDSANVYIGRKRIVFIDGKRFPEKDSDWANPFKSGTNQTKRQALERYEKYILDKISRGLVNLDSLRGKNLGCWCKPDECHGDVLLKLLNEN